MRNDFLKKEHNERTQKTNITNAMFLIFFRCIIFEKTQSAFTVQQLAQRNYYLREYLVEGEDIKQCTCDKRDATFSRSKNVIKHLAVKRTWQLVHVLYVKNVDRQNQLVVVQAKISNTLGYLWYVCGGCDVFDIPRELELKIIPDYLVLRWLE